MWNENKHPNFTWAFSWKFVTKEFFKTKTLSPLSGKMQSAGFGFVTFTSKAGANKALKELQHCALDGHNLELSRSTTTSVTEWVSSTSWMKHQLWWKDDLFLVFGRKHYPFSQMGHKLHFKVIEILICINGMKKIIYSV